MNPPNKPQSMRPSISIIVPAYNAEPYIEATLESIRNQSFTEWECIVVDDGSSDGTWKAVQASVLLDSRIRGISRPNSGAAASRNAGYAEATPSSKYVVFMDADDLYLKDALQTLHDAAEARPDLVGAHGIAEYIDSEGRPFHPGFFANYGRDRLHLQGGRLRPLSTSSPTNLAVLLLKAFHPPGTFIVRRDVINQVGTMDSQLLLQEDWDYWLRVARHGDFAFIDQVLLHYRKHNTNTSGNVKKSYRLARYVRFKTFSDPKNTPVQKDLIQRCYQAWQMHRIREKFEEFKAVRGSDILFQSLRFALHAFFHTACYMRGYPTRRF
ncbi:MAG: hypothetical protein QOE70_5825 [Chthoniobacter sp.]|jgi:glycosyltransferase involved in cell wall biosynthesis|nr:hypothetical protein [Chthoniobacter sp.]